MRKLFFVLLFSLSLVTCRLSLANDSLDYCPLPFDTVKTEPAVVIQPQSPILIVLDPAHGSDTPGKRSPEAVKLGKKNSSEPVDSSLIFFEYKFSRSILDSLERLLDSASVYHIRSNKSLKEIGLNKRVSNTNSFSNLWKSNPKKLFPDSVGSPSLDSVLKYPKSKRLAFFLSLHNNAAGYGILWEAARGFSAWTSRHYTYSDIAADIIIEEFVKEFPGIKIIGSLESNFRVLLCKPYAVLVECLFQDNKKDVLTLNSSDFQFRYTNALLRSILRVSALLANKL